MLSEAEKKWLEGKSDADYPAPCVRTGKRGLFDMRYCLRACEGNSASSPKYCPIASNFRDAAEFEARVAAKLALTYDGPEPCERNEKVKHCPWAKRVVEGKMTCKFCRLKHARLVVEQEMEKY